MKTQTVKTNLKYDREYTLVVGQEFRKISNPSKAYGIYEAEGGLRLKISAGSIVDELLGETLVLAHVYTTDQGVRGYTYKCGKVSISYNRAELVTIKTMTRLKTECPGVVNLFMKWVVTGLDLDDLFREETLGSFLGNPELSISPYDLNQALEHYAALAKFLHPYGDNYTKNVKYKTSK